MPTNFPTSVDNFTNPTANDSLNIPSHSLQHANANDAIEAIEAKLGIGDSSAGSAVANSVLRANGSGSTTWGVPDALVPIATQSFTNVSGVTVDNVFSATYANYLIRAQISTVSGSPTRLIGQLINNSGAVFAGTYYGGFAWYRAQTTANGSEAFTGGNFRMNVSNIFEVDVTMDLTSLNGADPKISGQVAAFDYNSDFGAYVSSGGVVMRGIRFSQDAGNITGTIRVYGYRNQTMNETFIEMIFNAETGEVSERPFTSAQIAERNAIAREIAQEQVEAQAKADARESALAKLAALGLTQDEINAL